MSGFNAKPLKRIIIYLFYNTNIVEFHFSCTCLGKRVREMEFNIILVVKSLDFIPMCGKIGGQMMETQIPPPKISTPNPVSSPAKRGY
jgi:hypothetical protein